MVYRNKRDFFWHGMHLKIVALKYKQRAVLSCSKRESIAVWLCALFVFTFVIVRMTFDFFSDERVWMKVLFVAAVPYSIQRSAFMALGLVVTDIPLGIVRAEIAALETMTNHVLLS